VSWPVGFAGSFHKELTGAQNVKFIARIYGVDTNALVKFVEDFAKLGSEFYQRQNEDKRGSTRVTLDAENSKNV